MLLVPGSGPGGGMPDKKRVLLVEDEPDVGQLLRVALAAEGYDVTLVRTAPEARRGMGSDRYDLVISDWRLPDGGDGMSIVNEAADQGIKTMLMSGYLFQLTEPDKRHDYLMKPMRPNELIAAVERLLGES